MAMANQGDHQNTAGVTVMEKRTLRQAPVAHFVSGLGHGECEEKVVWEIKNISELLEMSKEDLKDSSITFDAGQSIGIPATWHFYFSSLPSSSWIGDSQMYCYLALSSNSKATFVKASYSITLSCEGKTIVSHDFDLFEFRKDTVGGRARGCFKNPATLDATDKGRKALKVTLRVKVFSESSKNSEAKRVKQGGLISDLKKMLKSGDGADVEIKIPSEVDGEVDEASYTKMVHKSILMGRSPVFSKMFAKDGETAEAKTGKVVIKDLSPKGLDIFLHYLYTGKVLKDWTQVPEEIVNAAEKYGCGILKQYCGQNLISAVSTSNALTLYKLAELHKLSSAKSAIAEFIHNNTRAVLGVDNDVSDEPNGENGEQSEEEEMGDDA